MLHLSSQVTANLASYFGRYASHFTPSSSIIFYQCIVLVSDQVTVPTSQSGVIQYINSALNGSNHYGGTPGNELNCMGIIDKIPSASLITPSCMGYDGLATYTAKQTGRIGSALVTTLYGNATTAPSSFFPLTSATTLANAGTYTGASRSDDFKMYNYSFITNSVGTSGNDMIILDTLDIVAGQTYSFYGASFNFSSAG